MSGEIADAHHREDNACRGIGQLRLSCSGNWEPRALNVNAGTYHPPRPRRWHAAFQKLLCFELYRIDQPNIATTKNSAIIGMQLTPELSTIALENVAARMGLILDEPHFQTQTSLLCPVTMLHTEQILANDLASAAVSTTPVHAQEPSPVTTPGTVTAATPAYSTGRRNSVLLCRS